MSCHFRTTKARMMADTDFKTIIKKKKKGMSSLNCLVSAYVISTMQTCRIEKAKNAAAWNSHQTLLAFTQKNGVDLAEVKSNLFLTSTIKCRILLMPNIMAKNSDSSQETVAESIIQKQLCLKSNKGEK